MWNRTFQEANLKVVCGIFNFYFFLLYINFCRNFHYFGIDLSIIVYKQFSILYKEFYFHIIIIKIFQFWTFCNQRFYIYYIQFTVLQMNMTRLTNAIVYKQNNRALWLSYTCWFICWFVKVNFKRNFHNSGLLFELNVLF